MKKLLFAFVAILAIVLVIGCNARKNGAELEEDKTVAIVTTDEASAKPVAIDVAAAQPIGKLAVTSPEGKKLETNVGYHVVRGTAPSNTHAIQVNNYTLRHYRAGQATWNYIASTSIGTLKEGDNDYQVAALDAKGNKLDSVDFKIVYAPAEIPNLPGVGTPLLFPLLSAMMVGAGLLGFRRFRVK